MLDKFDLKWEGPYEITRILSNVNVEILRQEKGKKKPTMIVHVNRLKRFSDMNPKTDRIIYRDNSKDYEVVQDKKDKKKIKNKPLYKQERYNLRQCTQAVDSNAI